MEDFLMGFLVTIGIIILIIIGVDIYTPKHQVHYSKKTIEKYYYFNCSNIQSKDCEVLEKYKNK